MTEEAKKKMKIYPNQFDDKAPEFLHCCRSCFNYPCGHDDFCAKIIELKDMEKYADKFVEYMIR